jgi:hypothetical protein
MSKDFTDAVRHSRLALSWRRHKRLVTETRKACRMRPTVAFELQMVHCEMEALRHEDAVRAIAMRCEREGVPA